jgi:prophage maintenance system killer protein
MIRKLFYMALKAELVYKGIVDYLEKNQTAKSGELRDNLNIKVSPETIKRVLRDLVEDNKIVIEGQGRASTYRLSPAFEVFRPIDVEDYFKKEIDERKIKGNFNHELIRVTLAKADILTRQDKIYLQILQDKYKENISKLSATEYTKELERLAIDLSWKSSQIEGNTYSLLETERLIKDQEEATGKTKDEATMLLNHKKALDFIIEEPGYISPLTTKAIEDIHSILIADLVVDRNMRKHRVGISGTNYKPLENEHQIREAMQDVCALVNSKENIFEKALLLLVLLSYIQAFADGNKRTARIVSNAILINAHYCPLSFRTIDSVEYKKAMLIFYEQNNISAFKKIFIDQFEFAVNTYF